MVWVDPYLYRSISAPVCYLQNKTRMKYNWVDFHTVAYLKKEGRNAITSSINFFLLFLFKYHDSQSHGVLQELQGETLAAQAWAVQLNYWDLKAIHYLGQHLRFHHEHCLI